MRSCVSPTYAPQLCYEKHYPHISLELRAMFAAAASGPRELAAAASIAAAFAESMRIILSSYVPAYRNAGR